MNARLASITLAALALLNLSACTHYRYVKPDTEQGKQCVAKLDAGISDCERRAEESAKGQRDFYEWQMISYRACVQQSTPTAQLPQPCAGAEPKEPGAAEKRMCSQDYKESFIKCGGRLEEVKDK